MITPAGRRLLQRAQDVVSGVEEAVLSGLSEAEHRQLLELLRRAQLAAAAIVERRGGGLAWSVNRSTAGQPPRSPAIGGQRLRAERLPSAPVHPL